MAAPKRFLTSLNLSKNQLLNAVIHNNSTDLSAAVAGQVYYNTGDNTLRYYNGTAWITLAQGGDLASAITAAIDALDTDDIEEGASNLYFTDQRALDATSGAYDGLGSASAAQAAAEFYADGVASSAEQAAKDHANTLVGGLDTADIAEDSSNLYFTEGRARGSISAGDNTIDYNSSTGEISVDTSVVATVSYVDGEVEAALQTASDANNTLSSTLTTAYELADTNLSEDLTDAYQAADTALETSLTQDFEAADEALATTLRGEIAAASQGLDVKESVRVATTSNINLTAGTPVGEIDGVSLAFPSVTRVLVKNQTNSAENGIYEHKQASTQDGGNTWTRTDDALEITPGTFVFVEEGAAHGDSGFVVSTDGNIVVGTTNITWTQFSGAGTIVAGDGIVKTGSTLSVDAGSGITVDVNGVSISEDYAGQESIVTVGTITTGTWNGSTIDVAHGGTGATELYGYITGTGANALSGVPMIPGYDVDGDITGNAANVTGTVAIANGGTGATTAAGARSNLGATTKYTESNTTLNPTSNEITWTVSHGLNTQDVTVQMRDLGDNALVEADVVITNANTVTINWYSASTVSANAYRVVVVG